jgi:hypothetical protein
MSLEGTGWEFWESYLKRQVQLFTFCYLPFIFSLPGGGTMCDVKAAEKILVPQE